MASREPQSAARKTLGDFAPKLAGISRNEGSCKTSVGDDDSLGYPLSTHSDCGEEGDGWTVTNFALCSVLGGGRG